MANKYMADSMAEANAIVKYLIDTYDDYSASVSHHNLVVSWRNAELNADDWEAIGELYESPINEDDE